MSLIHGANGHALAGHSKAVRQGSRVKRPADARDLESSSTSNNGFEPILTSEQAAAYLKIHPKTLQRMARQGRIPAYRIGDLWRFRASELEAWLASTMICSNRHSCRE